MLKNYFVKINVIQMVSVATTTLFQSILEIVNDAMAHCLRHRHDFLQ